MGSLGQGSGLVGKKRQVIDGKIVTYPKPTVITDYTLPLVAIGSTETTPLANSTQLLFGGSPVSDFNGQPLTNCRDKNEATYNVVDGGGVTGVCEIIVEYNVAQVNVSKLYRSAQRNAGTFGAKVSTSVDGITFVDVEDWSGSTVISGDITFSARTVKAIRILQSSSNTSSQLIVRDMYVYSQDAVKTIDNNNATEYETALELNPFVRLEMSATIDKKPSAFYCRLGNNTTAESVALELSTNAIAWDRFNEFVVGADLLKGQDSFVEINLPNKDYRYYRWIVIDTVNRKLAIAETRFFAPTTTQVQYEHGHKKLF